MNPENSGCGEPYEADSSQLDLHRLRRAIQFSEQVDHLAVIADPDAPYRRQASYDLLEGPRVTVGRNPQTRQRRAAITYPGEIRQSADGHARRVTLTRQYAYQPLATRDEGICDEFIAQLAECGLTEIRYSDRRAELVAARSDVRVERQLAGGAEFRLETSEMLKTPGALAANLAAKQAAQPAALNYSPDEHAQLMALFAAIDPETMAPKPVTETPPDWTS